MSESMTTSQLRDDGWTHQRIRRAVASRELTRLRRGAFASGEPDHLIRVRAAVEACCGDVLVSHASAAILHGLPVRRGAMSTVHVTRKRKFGGRIAPDVHVYACPFESADIVEIEGMRVTSLARTLIDLGRHEPLMWSVAAGDAALRLGLPEAELFDRLASARRRPGVIMARRMSDLLDARAESPGESISRVSMIRAGLPAPDLQAVLPCWDGEARVDFLWPEFGLAGEFDGAIKYGRLVPEGQVPADVVVREKAREDGIRVHGPTMVRWGWAEATAPQLLGRVIRRGMQVGSRSPALPTSSPSRASRDFA